VLAWNANKAERMNLLEQAIAFVSPGWALNRAAARATLKQIAGVTGGGSTGYNAGKVNRWTKARQAAPAKENQIPGGQFLRLRAASWDLYRNNPNCRKVVRSLTSKVIGPELIPASLATKPDGSAFTEFRRRVKQLWEDIHIGFDLRGMPGRGGQTMGGLQRLAFRNVMISGEVLFRAVPISASEQLRRDLPIPVVMQVVDAQRLSEHARSDLIGDGNIIFRGVELDPDTGQRVAYWIDRPQYGVSNVTDPIRIPAQQMGHLFVEEDIDQVRGTPWFSSIIPAAGDTDDLEYNVIKSAAMAACVVLGYRKGTGQRSFGLNQSVAADSSSADGTDLTDEDGNAVTKIQPGMFVNLGADGDLKGFSPQQPTTNIEGFAQHMQRKVAAGVPGTKASTITGDFRNSSFSSERSADNDTWPEVGEVQAWFGDYFCQPLFESAVRSAVLNGYFDGVITAEQFAANSRRLLRAKWQGPVQKSINPKDDVKAARERISGGLSSLQMECAKENVDWRDVVEDARELFAEAERQQIPITVVHNILGVDADDVTEPEEPAEPVDQSDSEDESNVEANVEA
jgi:lambda family phage portal protein